MSWYWALLFRVSAPAQMQSPAQTIVWDYELDGSRKWSEAKAAERDGQRREKLLTLLRFFISLLWVAFFSGRRSSGTSRH